jgi:hypothetical protein
MESIGLQIMLSSVFKNNQFYSLIIGITYILYILLERFAFIDKNQYNDFVILDLNTLENDKNKNK